MRFWRSLRSPFCFPLRGLKLAFAFDQEGLLLTSLPFRWLHPLSSASAQKIVAKTLRDALVSAHSRRFAADKTGEER